MPIGARSSATQSLSSAGPGTVRIEHILLGAVRAVCASLGIEEGDVVECVDGTGSMLVLEGPSGRTVYLDRLWAQFIQVGEAAAKAEPEAPATTPSS